MPYLRGTTPRPIAVRVPQTLQNKVAKLERQVNLIKPGLNHYIVSEDPLSTAISPYAYQTATINVTDGYRNSPQFPTEITGDEYYNKRLSLVYTAAPNNVGLGSNVQQFRLIVYSPKVADQRFAPANTPTGFVAHPDPAAFNVYWDEVIENPNSLQPLEWRRSINLRMKKTIVNRSSSTIEKGPIKITLLYYNEEDNKAGKLGIHLITIDK